MVYFCNSFVPAPDLKASYSSIPAQGSLFGSVSVTTLNPDTWMIGYKLKRTPTNPAVEPLDCVCL